MKSSTSLAALVAHCRKLARRHQAPDADLLRRFAGHRDAGAFEELVERYAPLVWSVCRRMLSSEADCEDAFQAAFLVLVRRANSIALGRPLGAWLHTVAVHVSDKTRVRAMRQPRQTITSEPATCGDVADELEKRETFRLVDEEIARLPALLREPFVLCCLEGRTRDEAATALGCSVAAVKSRLERSRNFLRKRLERRGIGLPTAFLVLGLTGGHVRASLRAKAIQCAFGSAPSAVAALVPAAAMSLASKMALTAMSLVVVGVLGFGAFHVMQAEPPQDTAVPATDNEPKSSPSPAADKSPLLLDRLGDPLPEGAIRRFGTLRFRHHGMAGLAFTPDGKKLIVGGAGNPLLVFDAVTGRRLNELSRNSPQSRYLMALAVSPDGKRVAGCGSDVFVWELETGRLIRTFSFNDSYRYKEVVFSPDGSKMAAIKELQRDEWQIGIVIGDTASGRHAEDWLLQKGKPVSFDFRGLAFSPDGKFLAGAFAQLREERPFVHTSVSTQVWLLDAATGKRVRTFGSNDVRVVCFAFQPGSGRLATYGNDGMIRFWDVATGKEIQRFQAAKELEGNDFGFLRFSADGKRCALFTDRAKFLTVLDAQDGRVIRRIEGKESSLWVALALSADGGTVASARGYGGRGYGGACVRVWDVASGVERLADAGHRVAVTTLSLSADDRTLISQDEEGRRIHWDLQTGRGEARRNIAQEEMGRFIWSPDFSQMTLRGPRWRMVYKNQNPALLEVWSLDGAKLIRKLTVRSHNVPTVALSPDGAQLAIAANGANGNNHTVMLWDPEREEKPRTLPGTDDYCWELLFSHDGKRLVTRTGFYPVHREDAGAVWIWDAAQERLVRKLVTNGVPNHLRLTADDRVLLAGIGGGKDAMIRAWDMETGKVLANLVDPSLKPPAEINYKTLPAISGLALSADDRFLGVVSSWGEVSAVSIWETGTWKLFRAFAPISPRNDVKAMIFARDGRSLFVANSDTTILEWDLSGKFGRKTETPNQDRLMALWQALAQTPDKAYPAAWELLDHPAQSVPFLIAKLAPVQPVDEKRVRQLLSRLDSESFAQREEANRQLRALGERILPLLRQALKERPALEVKKRVEGVIESLNLPPTPEQLRLLRGLAVLEWSNRPDAVEHLRQLAGGAPFASLTQAAKAAARRLQEKSLGRPPVTGAQEW